MSVGGCDAGALGCEKKPVMMVSGMAVIWTSSLPLSTAMAAGMPWTSSTRERAVAKRPAGSCIAIMGDSFGIITISETSLTVPTRTPMR